MQAKLPTSKEDIFPQGAANTGGSQRAACSLECAPSCPKLNLGRAEPRTVMLRC